MEIIERATGLRKLVTIKHVEMEDFKILTKKRFWFSWKTGKNLSNIYKLQITGEEDILGAISLINYPAEKRVEIKLLASSAENTGQNKLYTGIAGCLVAFACRIAVRNYGTEACVSLIPKTGLIDHYMNNYYMKHAGRQLYIDGKELIRLLKEYAA